MKVKDEAAAADVNAESWTPPTKDNGVGKRQVKLLGVKKNYSARLTLCLVCIVHWMTVSDLTKPSFVCIQKAT